MSDLHIEILISNSLDTVWNHWTSSDLITKWFPPEANIEPKLNGAFELFFNPENHMQQSTIGCKIIIFEHKKQLGFTWKDPDGFSRLMNNEDNLTQVVINFKEVNGKTIIKLTHKGWGDSEEWDKAKDWHYAAWDMSLKSLKKLLN